VVKEAVLDGEEQAAQMEKLHKEQEQNIKVSLTSLTLFDFTGNLGIRHLLFCKSDGAGCHSLVADRAM